MNMRLIEHNPLWRLAETHRVRAQQSSYAQAPPRVQRTLKAPALSVHKPQQGNAVPDKPRILIVDCESTTALLSQALVQTCHIQRVPSVDQILEVARCPDQSPDLILLNSLVPSHPGLDICRQLKADETTQSIPVILIVDSDNAEDEACALEVGVEDCITRPFQLNVIEARIRNQIRLKLKHDLLERYANQDGLTEVANRRRFDLALDVEWRRAIRDEQSLSLVMVDVDCFKQFNDLYGHREGDLCLRRVAKAMSQALTRPGDVLARYGGEEFAAILPGTDIEGAHWMGERLRHAVMELGIPQQRPDGVRRVSISVGCASVRPSPNLACYSLLQAADEKLYLAKNSGRNCVR
ncbi:MAG: GGDEF domain-containing response regulator [Thiobacillus sp.]